MKLNNKIAGFSLLETVIAMLLVVLSISISSLLLVQSSKTNLSRNTEVVMELKQLALEEKRSKVFIDRMLEKNTYFVECEYQLYTNSDQLIHMKLIAFDEYSNREIERWEELVPLK